MTGPRLVAGAGQHSSAAAKGGEGTVFGVPVKAGKVVFVIDRSLSMGPARTLSRARDELVKSLRQLSPSMQFQVILYNQFSEPLSLGRQEKWHLASAETIDRVEGLLAATHAEGSTDHFKALLAGLSLDPEVIFLVTDGDGITMAPVREITRLNRGGAVIHVIDVGPTATPSE